MASGRDRHEARKAAVAALGRGLSRRARSTCELCGDSASLRVVEVPPIEDEPSEDGALLACDRCRDAMSGRYEANDLRFLEGSAWSEVAPVKIAAVRLLRALSAADVSWATDCLDGLWLDEETTARLEA